MERSIAGREAGGYVPTMKPVTLAAFNSLEEAEPLRQRLGEVGIWSQVRRDGAQDAVEMSRPTAGFRLDVRREDFERALAVVYAWNLGDDVDPGAEAAHLGWMRSGGGGGVHRSQASGSETR